MAYEILTNEQMAEADRKTIADGVPGYELMCRAGTGVVKALVQKYKKGPVLVLCGPGNNGGDGFVIARLLKEQGRDVRLACLVQKDDLKNEAREAATAWDGNVLSFEALTDIPAETLIVDAVFGAGLSKPLEKPVSGLFEKIRKKGNPVIAVDVPSGVNGTTGAVDPHTLKAQETVTFHRKKFGHVLVPGAAFCGDVIVHDIGLTSDFDFSAYENHPDLWRGCLPSKSGETHKYKHGHALVYGAPELTGATRLAAEACARMGTGLVTVLAPPGTGDIYRETLAAHILVRDDMNWMDEKVSALLYGPGGLSGQPDYDSAVPAVLDADALRDLPEKLGENFILTPHEGEFKRVFADIEGSRPEKARAAAAKSGAYIVLKGADTIITAPDGRMAVNTHASPALATAGTGDVLAGMITGLVAQNMPVFEALCAAVWVHGECAVRFGSGLVASDLPGMIPQVLKDFT